MSASLINAVPLAMLGLAELLVILSGRGGIDLSVGAIVSLAGMVFGFAYGEWGWSLWSAILLTAVFGALLGAVNGFLVAYVGFPALIATLATFYAYKSLAIVINDQSPISTPPIQELFSITRSVELPLFGQYVPDIPLGLFTFLLPTVVVAWLLLARSTYGRRLYGIGTNDVAARWAGLPVRDTRFKAYTYAGLISGSSPSSPSRSSPPPGPTPASPATAWPFPPSRSPCSAAWRSPVASAGWPASSSRRCWSCGSTPGSCSPSRATRGRSTSCSRWAPC